MPRKPPLRSALCTACGARRGLVSDWNNRDTAAGRRPVVLRLALHRPPDTPPGSPRCIGSGWAVRAEDVLDRRDTVPA